MRLALQSLYIVGASINDGNTELRQIHFNADEGFSSILAGKEFMLMISSSGKVFSVVKAICVLKVNFLFYLKVTYQGKASSLGLKTVGELIHKQEQTSNRWYELPLPKSPPIIRCATGHDGLHAVFLSADGTAFFAGLAKRGEDGDLSTT